jgi:hypothetical protein
MVADFSSRWQQLTIFGMKGIVPVEHDAGNLTRRDVDAKIPKLFQDPILGDVILMGLQQDLLPQSEPDVRRHTDRAWHREQRTVRQAINGPAVAGIARFDDQALDDKITITFQHSTVGQEELIMIDAVGFRV